MSSIKSTANTFCRPEPNKKAVEIPLFYYMKYKVTKLDNRYSHRDSFEYMLEFSRSYWTGTGVLDFDHARKWFNKTYGWSQDVETRGSMIKSGGVNSDLFDPNDINAHWAYCAKYNNYRIYVATDKELNWFMLSHPRSV